MKRERIFVLGDANEWEEINDKKQLEHMLHDGDIGDGDLVVFSTDVLQAEHTTVLKREEETE
jgi:hypothetical protein